jgi:hypothetical protein
MDDIGDEPLQLKHTMKRRLTETYISIERGFGYEM